MVVLRTKTAEEFFTVAPTVMQQSVINVAVKMENAQNAIKVYSKNKKEGKQDDAMHCPVSTSLVIPITRVVQKHPNTYPDVFYFL